MQHSFVFGRSGCTLTKYYNSSRSRWLLKRLAIKIPMSATGPTEIAPTRLKVKEVWVEGKVKVKVEVTAVIWPDPAAAVAAEEAWVIWAPWEVWAAA